MSFSDFTPAVVKGFVLSQVDRQTIAITGRARRFFLSAGLVLSLALFASACERPPVIRDATVAEDSDGGTVLPANTIAPNMEGYINDLYALGHKWYQHESGVLSPKDQVYLIRDQDQNPTAYYKFEVVTYYDLRGNSGFFTLAIASWDGAAWGEAQEMVLSANIKTAPPICVNLTNLSEVDCSGQTWQLQFLISQYLSPEILYSLTINPTIFVRSTAGQGDRGGVQVAMYLGAELDDVQVDPTTVPELNQQAPSELGQLLDFDHQAWSPNIPLNGMVIGRAWSSEAPRDGHVYFLRSMDKQFTKFSLSAQGQNPSEVLLHYQTAVEDEGLVALPDAPEQDLTIPLPQAYAMVYVDFSSSPAIVELEGDFLYAPPRTRDWDLAFEVTSEGVQVLVSPADLIWDWTASPAGAGSTDFAVAQAPVYP